MNKVKRPRINNKSVLDGLAALEPSIAAIKTELRAHQKAYFVGDRNPTTLRPIGLLDPVAIWLRERYAAARVGDGLNWIEKLREAHDLDCCPMCGGTGVTQLDHVLPKAQYPEFAVFSFNLVPTCGDCNRRRSNKGRRYHFVHPYFDTTLLDDLRMKVTFRPPYDTVRFMLAPTGLLGSDMLRVEQQIRQTLPLLVFRRRVRRCWKEWHRRFQLRGAGQVIQRLQDELLIQGDTSQNSWEVAFMRGLSIDAAAQSWMATTLIPSAD